MCEREPWDESRNWHISQALESLLSERLFWEKTGIVTSENEERRRATDFQQSPEAVLGEIF